MHSFSTARRPKIVYGRVRGVQRRRRERTESSASSSGSSSEVSRAAEAAGESDADSVSGKENDVSASEITSAAKMRVPVLQKGKAVPTKRKPLRSKVNEAVSSSPKNDASLQSDSEKTPEDERISQRRRKPRGTELRPIILSSASESSDVDVQHGSDVDDLVEQWNAKVCLRSQAGKLLLDTCVQTDELPFDECLDELEDQAGGTKWTKIGEATYSEVYRITGSDMVLKVIPLHDADNRKEGAANTSQDERLPERSRQKDVLREINITRTLAGAHGTFVKLHRAAVVRGGYARRLLRAWQAHKAAPSSESQNICPDAFPSDQRYALLLLADGGQSLECFQLTSWTQAASVVVQVTQALAHAERTFQFEHRDLHWGNVVVKAMTQGRPPKASKLHLLDLSSIASARWSGVQATVIDYTLSRARLGGPTGPVTAHPLDDEDFFSGQGDAQFDVYRHMRLCTDNDWHGFYPRTNVLWLRYLLAKILDCKNLERASLGHATDVKTVESHCVAEATCFAVLTAVRETLDGDVQDGSQVGEKSLCDAASVSDLLSSVLTELCRSLL